MTCRFILTCFFLTKFTHFQPLLLICMIWFFLYLAENYLKMVGFHASVCILETHCPLGVLSPLQTLRSVDRLWNHRFFWLQDYFLISSTATIRPLCLAMIAWVCLWESVCDRCCVQVGGGGSSMDVLRGTQYTSVYFMQYRNLYGWSSVSRYSLPLLLVYNLSSSLNQKQCFAILHSYSSDYRNLYCSFLLISISDQKLLVLRIWYIFPGLRTKPWTRHQLLFLYVSGRPTGSRACDSHLWTFMLSHIASPREWVSDEYLSAFIWSFLASFKSISALSFIIPLRNDPCNLTLYINAPLCTAILSDSIYMYIRELNRNIFIEYHWIQNK